MSGKNAGDQRPDTNESVGTIDAVRTSSLQSDNLVGRAVTATDRHAERVFHRIRGPKSLPVVRNISRSGDGGALWLILLAYLARENPRVALRATGILIAGAAVVNLPVKAAFKRQRPEPLPVVTRQPSGSSFPSGHAFTSWFAVALLPGGRPLKAFAGACAALVSTSRVYMRYHHMTDVMAGALLGWTAGRALVRFLRW